MRTPLRSNQAPIAALEPYPPQWVYTALGAARPLDSDELLDGAGSRTQIVTAGSLMHLATSIPNAAAMTKDELRQSVADTYLAVAQNLDARHRHPIRFWNFVPAPGTMMDPGLDRYMVFNAGRHDAYVRWHGGRNGFSHSFSTASAVGVHGRELVIHCLASDSPGAPVENPRQVPAWRYSERYGPLPPCFARATRAMINGRGVLLIGGTASIVGEDSLHAKDVSAQLEETLRNLASLIAAARGASQPDGDELHRMVEVRVYVVQPQHAVLIRSRVAAHCPRVAAIEMAIADVCRPELLVEIEGVAVL